MKLLINSTVLSNFAAIDRLTMLRELYGTVYIAETVYEEAQVGLEEGYGFLAGLDDHISPFHSNGWLHLVNLQGEDEFACYDNMPPKLHRGEAVSLAIAAHRHWGFLTDDRAARRYANTLGVEISGTLGVLVHAVKRGIFTLTEANELLARMVRRARYHAPLDDLGPLL